VDSFSTRVRQWQSEGEFVSISAHRIFVRRVAGDGPLLVLLHGFPSSSFDWRNTLRELPGQAALTLDFLGFGLSDKPRDVTYSLFTQADLVQALLSGHDGPVALAAHDMGTSVATELLARDLEGRLPFTLGAVLLFNGSMILKLASLTWAQRALRSPAGPLVARLSNPRAFKRQFARLFSPQHPLDAAEAEDQWALWRHAGGAHLAHRLVHYLGEREVYADRWHGAIRAWPGPLRFAWGMHDPVATPAVLAGLRQLRPAAPVSELADLGHYPQVEAPERIAAELRTLLASL
jgi:pimeloyl-ACP methyl ester carboxylesterase